MAEATADRLTRLLALVAYLRDHPGVRVTEVAEHFGTSEAQVLADVNLLWVTGTPGYLPDDLIDFSVDALDDGALVLTQARGMDRPLRLSTSEALALLVGLRALDELTQGQPGIAERGSLDSARDKLTAAAGVAAAQAAAVQVHVDAAAPARTLATVRDALARGRRLRLRYVSVADVVTEREVDPVELRSDGETWSLRAWCHRAGGPRTFRLDRVLDLETLDVPVGEHDLDEDVPPWAGEGNPVTVRLRGSARWVTEHVPVDEVLDADDGSILVRLRAGDRAWFTGWLLSLGDAVLEVRPAEAAHPAAHRAAAALHAYGLR